MLEVLTQLQNGRSGVESGTLRTRLSHTLIRTDMFRHSIFTQSLMDAIFTMTLQSSSHQKTLSSPAILTQSVFLKLRNCLLTWKRRGMVPASTAGFLRLRFKDFSSPPCTVQWDNPAAPLVDVSDFGRKQEEGYGNTETKADQTENNYSDTSSAVKITQTYTEDNSDLLSGKDNNSYSQDTSADIVETKAPEPVY